MIHAGWLNIGFARSFERGLNPLILDAEPYLLVRDQGGWALYDGRCPHRGAVLALGGVLEDDYVVCPFHGLRVRLGAGMDKVPCVRSYAVFEWDGVLFARIGNLDEGFPEFVAQLQSTWRLVPGFTLPVAAPAALVIENAFDPAHFSQVHGVPADPVLALDESTRVGLRVSGSMTIPRSDWQRDPAGQTQAQFSAHAFSPTIVVSIVDGFRPYLVITGTLPTPAGSLIFLSVGLPHTDFVAAKDADYLISQARAGLEQDRIVWEAIDHEFASKLKLPGDELVDTFRVFCRKFSRE